MKEEKPGRNPLASPDATEQSGLVTSATSLTDNGVKLFSKWDGEVSALKRGADPSERVIISYGFPGSGSTVMWQILDFLFGNVRKTASCPVYRDNSYMVATVRDFRDVLCTYLKRTNLSVTRANIDVLVKAVAQDEGVFAELELISEVWKVADGRILWLRYEDFFDNYEHIFEQVAAFLQRRISDEEKRQITTRFNLEANRERARRADALNTMDDDKGWLEMEWNSFVVDGINAKHITSDGTPGKWRHIIPPTLHSYVTELLREPLQKFGYL